MKRGVQFQFKPSYFKQIEFSNDCEGRSKSMRHNKTKKRSDACELNKLKRHRHFPRFFIRIERDERRRFRY